MKKINLLFLFLMLILAGCSSKKKVVSTVDTSAFEESSATTNSGTFTKNLVQKIQELENSKDFKTLYIKANARYEDSHQTQNVQADIRIKKDEIILVSIRFLGITMAKALITQDKVQYYEKPNGTHFEGDYATLSRWLSTDLNFEKLQNLLIGNALFDLSKENLESKSIENETGLFSKTKQLEKVFWIENNNNQLIKQSFHRIIENQKLHVHYPSFQNHNGIVLPSQTLIEATQEKQKKNI